MKHRLNILHIWVDPVDMREALARVEEFVEHGDKLHTIFAVNPEKSFSFPRDPLLYQCFRTADLLIPDGIGIVMPARLLHGARLRRVPGIALMAGILPAAFSQVPSRPEPRR